jgi:hypothetical protein
LAALAERDWYVTYARQHPEQFAERDAMARASVESLAREILTRPPVRRRGDTA